MKRTVLVFPCGSEIGLEIHKSLSSSTHFKLIGASSVDDHGEYVYQNYISGLPLVDDEDFVDKLNEVVEKNEVDYIFPAHDSVVLILAKAKADGRLKCDVITSPIETCEIARSKGKTYEKFKSIVPTPMVYDSQLPLPTEIFPLFLKPDVGQGSKGTYFARDNDDVDFYIKKDPTLLVLEYLSGKEYTVDCFTDKSGTLIFSEGRERKRVSNGISVNSTTVRDDRFLEIAKKINDTIPFRGVWFFQVKERADGELVLMEIAPRIAGTMGLVRCKGVNLALLSLFDAMGLEVEIFENSYDITIDRALSNSYKINIRYDNVYLDLDDLLIVDMKVEPRAMAFVFQCINNGIKVNLLTRHKQDLNKTLENFRLQNIFDRVIWIKNDTPKQEFIIEKNAIFIDDSFAERKAVHDSLGIPVFDAHMLESLIDNVGEEA